MPSGAACAVPWPACAGVDFEHPVGAKEKIQERSLDIGLDRLPQHIRIVIVPLHLQPRLGFAHAIDPRFGKGRSSGAGVLREAADAYGDQQDGADVGGRHQKRKSPAMPMMRGTGV